jgi:hypothetical protein
MAAIAANQPMPLHKYPFQSSVRTNTSPHPVTALTKIVRSDDADRPTRPPE